ncbi:MAG: L,D-transpeptidase family protein [Bacillus sp. (in: firmicutes)]
MQRKPVIILVIIFFTLAGFIRPASDAEAASAKHLIVINKKNNQMAYYANGTLQKTFSVGTGRKASYTPEGTFKIVNKIKNRPYYAGNIPGGSSKNPLGVRWLGLHARGTYGTIYAIHGNNNPSSIGKYVSAGCIRMHNDQVSWLFDRVPVGTTVIITTSALSFNAIAQNKGYAAKGSPTKAVSANPSSFKATLKKGSKGPQVKTLQQQLLKRGFNPKGVDGVYGNNTVIAVKNFQKSKKLKADGIAGPKTLRALGL